MTQHSSAVCVSRDQRTFAVQPFNLCTLATLGYQMTYVQDIPDAPVMHFGSKGME